MAGPKVANVRTGDEPAAAPPKAAGLGIVYVIDTLNRKIGLKKLKPSERFSLEEATQTKTPSGEMQAIFVASVLSIGDEGMTPIASRKELLQRLDELGDEGLVAITPACLKLYGIDLTQKDIDAVKNS